MSSLRQSNLVNKNGFCIKLLTYFRNNIKKTYICEMGIILVTNDDVIYHFDNRRKIDNDSISEIESLEEVDPGLIERFQLRTMSGVEVIKFTNSENQIFAITDHQVFNWGFNFRTPNGKEPIYGRKGKAYWDQYFSPLVIANFEEKIRDISCGAYHTLVLTENNRVFGWGSNRCGQLGDITTELYLQTPIELTLKNIIENNDIVVEISCGYYHSMIRTENRCVYACGYNKYKQLGIMRENTTQNIVKFEKLIIENNGNLVNFVKISCGRLHSLLLSHNGDIHVFGNNDSFQLGTRNIFVPKDEEIARLQTPEGQSFPQSEEKVKAYKNLIEPKNKFIDKKVIDIASHFSFDISIARSEDDKFYIWGKCGDKPIKIPLKSVFRSFEDIFLNYCGITYTLLEGNHKFFEQFIEDGKLKKDFNILGEVKGSFGVVYTAESKDNLEISAIKEIKYFRNFWKSFRELEICHFLIGLNSKYIVETKAFWFETGDEEIRFCIQMEKCDINFEDVIIEMYNDSNLIVKVSEEQRHKYVLSPFGYYMACQFFQDIVRCVNYLHQLEPAIIHRDLKPTNILLKNGIIKLADFDDIAFHHFKDQTHTDEKGTFDFRAPEVTEYNKKYDTRADIYSLGIVFKKLFNLDIYRFNTIDSTNNSTKLMSKYENARIFCDKLTEKQFEGRPTCKDILEYIKNVNSWVLCEEDLKHEFIDDFLKIKNFFKSTNHEISESFVHQIIKTKIDSISNTILNDP